MLTTYSDGQLCENIAKIKYRNTHSPLPFVCLNAGVCIEYVEGSNFVLCISV